VAGQAFYLFNCRTLRAPGWLPSVLFANRAAWIAVAVLLVLQLLFVYVPVMNTWFGSAPLKLRHWLVPIAVGFTVFVVVELEKIVYNRISPIPGTRRRRAP